MTPSAGACWVCGYDQSGLPIGGVCPECGCVQRDEREVFDMDAMRRRRGRWGSSLVIGVFGTGALFIAFMVAFGWMMYASGD